MNIRLIASLSGAGLVLAAAPSAQQIDLQPRMGDPVPGLSAAEMVRFVDGKAEFDTILSQADGLGPVFNDTSCGQCHSGPITGGASGTFVIRFGIADFMGMGFDPLDGSGPSGLDRGGTLNQKSGLLTIDPSCEEPVAAEATVTTNRTTPHCFGAGLLEAVPDAQIAANVGSSVNVSGTARVTQPVEGGPTKLGRFGWKGGVASVLTFSADASLNEMGLTNRFFGTDNAPGGDLVALALCDTVSDPEDFMDPMTGLERIDRQADFQRFLAPPPQTPKVGMSGEALFNAIGCADCHVASYTTSVGAEAVLNGKTIRPYSDFLLHDMGATGAGGCGDGIIDGPATEQIMMTRALWGLGDRGQFLHDGRATGGTFGQNIDATVADHGGEAAFSRSNYNGLLQSERDAIYLFLESLGQPEFDYDPQKSTPGAKFDNDVDEFDWFFLELDGWFIGPTGAGIGPDDAGSVADIDQDGDFDMFDWAHLQRAFSG
jgi:hypothetical protein